MKTTIQVEKEIVNMLKELKLTKRESYEEIIIRLIKKNAGGKE